MNPNLVLDSLSSCLQLLDDRINKIVSPSVALSCLNFYVIYIIIKRFEKIIAEITFYYIYAIWKI